MRSPPPPPPPRSAIGNECANTVGQTDRRLPLGERWPRPGHHHLTVAVRTAAPHHIHLAPCHRTIELDGLAERVPPGRGYRKHLVRVSGVRSNSLGGLEQRSYDVVGVNEVEQLFALR